MKFVDTSIPDVKIIEPTIYGDERGFFMETFRADLFSANCSKVTFVQDNHSKSSKGTLRGLHYQTENTQGKLVRVTHGEVFDVAVDMRRESKTFGQWVGVYLSASNNKQLWVPEGFAHGFYVTSHSAEFLYKCTDFYNPQKEVSLCWNDPKLSIEWPLSEGESLNLSEKDANGISFDEAPKL